MYGLTALEYGTMCLYYDSQPYPSQFLERVEEGDVANQAEENEDGEELDEILSGMVIRNESEGDGGTNQ